MTDPATDEAYPPGDQHAPCPDGGTCHHDCAAGCFRVALAGPLSGVYPGDQWPAGVRALGRAWADSVHPLDSDEATLPTPVPVPGDVGEPLAVLEAALSPSHDRVIALGRAGWVVAPTRDGVLAVWAPGDPARLVLSADDARMSARTFGWVADRLPRLNATPAVIARAATPAAVDEGAETQAPTTREALGRRVREVWVEWAREQPDPKPHWLTGWDDLDEKQREVDMRIGEALAGPCAESSEPDDAELLASLLGQYDLVVQAHAAVVMDTPEDQALHDRVVAAFRDYADTVRAVVATRPAPVVEG